MPRKGIYESSPSKGDELSKKLSVQRLWDCEERETMPHPTELEHRDRPCSRRLGSVGRARIVEMRILFLKASTYSKCQEMTSLFHLKATLLVLRITKLEWAEMCRMSKLGIAKPQYPIAEPLQCKIIQCSRDSRHRSRMVNHH